MTRALFVRICLTATAALGLSLILQSEAAAQTMYKYTDANGKVIYSDTQPPKGVKFTTIQANTKPTGVDLRTGNSPGDADTMRNERLAREAAHAQALSQAQSDYDSAVRELEAAKEPREGERAQNANGTSRLTEGYFSRIAPLEQKVEQMRQNLEAAKRG